MKFLVLRYTRLAYDDLIEGLEALGHIVKYISYTPESFEQDPKLETYLTQRFEAEEFDGMITFNYFQVVAKVCYQKKINYISWIWDSPMLTLYSQTIHYPTNYMFVFDRYLYDKLKSAGVKTVYHLSLAVNSDRISELEITDDDVMRFSDEVSFVGRIYRKKISYDAMVGLPPYLRGYLDAVMLAQSKLYGCNFLKEVLQDSIMAEVEKYVKLSLGEGFTGSAKDVFYDFFMGTKATQLERVNLLSSISKHFNLSIYTDDNTSDLKEIKNKGFVDYYTEMPKIFALSKININMSHRSIRSGIPLRVFDILGAGGFLITNYQSELLDYFTENEDLVVFYSEEDLIQKISYYLQHEEERKQIAKNGYDKVVKYHKYEKKISSMLETVYKQTDSTRK